MAAKKKGPKVEFPLINVTPAYFQFVSEMGGSFLPFLCLKRAHLCLHASSVHPSVDRKLQELLQCSPPHHHHPPTHPPPCNWIGSCRRANKERISGSQNGERERGRGRVVLSNLPQVNHMTQAVSIRKPWRLRQLATISARPA